MTPALIVLNSALDVRAANLAQGRMLHAAYRLVQQMAGTDLTPLQASMVAEADQLMRDFAALNLQQGESVCQIAGVADQLAPPERPLSLNAVVRMTRDHLANLCNPAISKQLRARSERAVFDVLERSAPSTVGSWERPNETLRHELGKAKTAVLWDLVARAISTSIEKRAEA